MCVSIYVHVYKLFYHLDQKSQFETVSRPLNLEANSINPQSYVLTLIISNVKWELLIKTN